MVSIGQKYKNGERYLIVAVFFIPIHNQMNQTKLLDQAYQYQLAQTVYKSQLRPWDEVIKDLIKYIRLHLKVSGYRVDGITPPTTKKK